MTFADKAIKYFLNLDPAVTMPAGASIINPYKNSEVKKIVTSFYKKYYDNREKRIFVLGINPGRFGGGLTGISFTDPAALRTECLIRNNLGIRKELSSEFIYKMITRFGGPEKFFSGFFLSALFPLAIIKDGKNYNFYDDSNILKLLLPSVSESVKCQADFGADRKNVICLGIKNGRYLRQINEEQKLFGKIAILEHPRYIMQYKRKFLDKYIEIYLSLFNNLLTK